MHPTSVRLLGLLPPPAADVGADVGASAPWSAGQGFTEPQTPGTVAYSLGAKHFAGQYAAFWLEKQ